LWVLAAGIVDGCILKTESTCDELGVPCGPMGGRSSAGGTAGEFGNGGTNGSRGGGNGLGGGGDASGGAAAGEGGAGASGGEGGAPNDCDTSKAPSVDACVATDAHTIFVAPTGSDKADGTQLTPVKTITQALALASESGKVVIACNGKFDEHLSLKAGVRLYGGFACPGEKSPWTYQTGKRAQVTPTTTGLALEVRSVTDAVTIEDMEFASIDAATPGESSIAAIIESSPSVALARVKIVAGKGAAGADGVAGAKGADGDLSVGAQKGLDAACGIGALDDQAGGKWPTETACGSRGGAGGPAQKGSDGGPGFPGNPRTNLASTQPSDLENGGPKGLEGGDGNPGASGNPGGTGKAVADNSSFSAVGLMPSPVGGSGTDGFPGQGGGGGGASNATGMCIGASGGAGGMGGCGGKGGTGGAGGGASVALISWSSNITLDTCELVASNGGVGGKGGDGGLGGLGKDGAVGGAADTTNSIGKGGKGGPGGNGGSGGPGAGGNGGPSVVLVVHGAEPLKLKTSTLTTGQGGTAGPGGAAGSLVGESGNAGSATAQLSVP
jgi:hypothetical protein